MIDIAAVAWFLVAVVTLLGDPLVIVAVGLGVHWRGHRIPLIGERIDRRRSTVLVGTVFAALALTSGLKTALAISRPAGAGALPAIDAMGPPIDALYTWIVGPGGYAFPSGHSIGATVSWGGLAWVIADDDRRPFVGAGLAIAAIAASRVALGVHRPAEVTVGVAIGIALLVLSVRLLPTLRGTFALSSVIGVAALALVELDSDGLLAAGGAVGVALGWELQRDRGHSRSIALFTGVVAAVAAFVAVRSGPQAATLALAAIVGGVGAIAIPAVRGRVENE